ncbi:hypothetical protein BKA61DRAFT_696949 [Leptodontidium sp. MPI-SDFR-AT-0119]|nr:hypothetical protein BKA61DRAFT_696949 [Leptodontidium sp. MPI-SDFR-AT-0119]
MKIIIIVALVVMTLFTGLLAVSLPTHKVAWMALQALALGPYALVTVSACAIVSLHIQLRHLGLAYGVIGTFRSAGGSLGNAIFSTILTGVVDKELPKLIIAAAMRHGVSPESLPALIPAAVQNAVGIPGAFAAIPDMTPELEAAVARAVKEAYGYAFQMVFYSMIPFGVLGILAAGFIRDSSEYLTNHTAVHLENGGVLGHGNKQNSHKQQKRSLCLITRFEEPIN